FLVWCVLALLGWDMRGGADRTVRPILAGVGVALSAMLFEGGWVLGLFLGVWMLFGQGVRAAAPRSLAIVGLASLVMLGPWFYGMVKSGDYRALILRPGLHLPTAPGVDPPLWEGSGENLLISKLSGLARSPWWTV